MQPPVESNTNPAPSQNVWDFVHTTAERKSEIRKIVSDSANFTPEYVAMNLLATVVAAYGLLQNSTAVVIGAMIIAMLLGPINGLALAVNDSNFSLLKRAGFAESVGAGAVFATALVIGKMHSNIPVGTEMMARTAPNVFDLFIALAGGAAGAYAVVSPKLRSGVVGVAIATALVPPLATAGLLIARGGIDNVQLGFGALLLFVTNLVTIQAAASMVFWIFGVHSPIRATERGVVELVRRNGISLGLIVLIGIFLTITFQGTLAKNEKEADIRRMLTALISVKQAGSALADLNVQRRDSKYEAFAVVRTPVSFAPEQVKDIEVALSNALGESVQLFIRSVITKEASSGGWLHVSSDEPEGDEGAPTAFPGDEPSIPATEPGPRTIPLEPDSQTIPKTDGANEQADPAANDKSAE